tara:strand:+ start:320 stop:559 length:240 start_codon:yes stop_codon:yes gene_type:complete
MTDFKWEFRVVKEIDRHTEEKKYSVQEVLMDEDNCLCSHSTDFFPRESTVEELKKVLEEMIKCLDKPLFSEFPERPEHD